jgi:TrmH family RNA methyltransferase
MGAGILMITSRQNPKIKYIQQLNSHRKYREKESAYVVEGIRILEEALPAGKVPLQILYSPEIDQRGHQLLEKFKAMDINCLEAAPDVFKTASDTSTPQGILAVFSIDPPCLPDRLDLVLIADQIRDPGNLGTLMRTCLGADADLLVLVSGSVDPYSPKVVRSGMGAHFRLPVISAAWSEIPAITGNLTLYLADMKKGKSLWDTDLSGAVGLIIGGEAHGAGDQARNLASQTIHIPMNPDLESLNAAAAAAILLFESRRQRCSALD